MSTSVRTPAPTATTDSSADEIIFDRSVGPFAMIPQWIFLCPQLKHAAVRLYGVLVSHLNQGRTDRTCWPGRDRLALMMGLSRGDKITPYLRQLELVGAVTIHRGADRNVYEIHSAPPAGQTVTGVCDWTRDPDNRARLDAARGQAAADRAARRPRPAADSGPATTGTICVTSTPRTPVSGCVSAPKTGCVSAPFSGPELEEVEPQPTNQPVAAPHDAKPQPGRTAVDQHHQPTNQATAAGREAAQLINQVLRTAGVPSARRALARRSLTAPVTALLQAGWTTTQLVDALGDGLGRSTSPVGVLHYRIANLDDPPVLPGPVPARSRRTGCPDHECDSHQTGRPGRVPIVLNGRDDRVVPCRHCHPDTLSVH